MKTHRLLKEGDVIEEGDEWRTAKSPRWSSVYSMLIGIEIRSNIQEAFRIAGLEFRRPI